MPCNSANTCYVGGKLLVAMLSISSNPFGLLRDARAVYCTLAFEYVIVLRVAGFEDFPATSQSTTAT